LVLGMLTIVAELKETRLFQNTLCRLSVERRFITV